MALRTVGVRLTAEVSDYQRKMRDAAKTTRDLRAEMEQAAKGGGLDAVADQAAGAGIALVGVAGAAVKLSMDYEKAMSAVGAATRASGEEMEQLRKATLQAGKDTQYSATKAAEATTELAKAGVATADILGGGLGGALDLAAAGQLDVAEAAETAASAMTQFKLKGADIPHIADLLAAAAGKAQGTVHDMGMALNQAGLVAAQTGLSIEETTGGLAAFASAGLTGSDAGTSFKQMLLMLQAPSGKTKELMDQLGISLYDAQGQTKGLAQFAGELKTKMATLTPEVRANAMATIFGADAVRGASILYEQGADGIQKWIDKVNDAGFASETAAKLTDNLAGDLERLKGSLETLAIENGSGANSGLRVLSQGAEALVDEFSQLPPVIGGTVTVLAGLSGAALLAGAGWIKMRRTTADAIGELEASGPAGKRAASGLQSVTKWAGRAAVAMVAFEAAHATIGAFQSDLNPQVEALAGGLAEFGKSGTLAGESARLLGGDMQDLKDVFQVFADDTAKSEWARALQGGLESLIPGLDGTETSLARTRERVTALDGALSQLVQGGKTAEAEAAFAQLAEKLANGNISMDEFKKQFPQYAAALEVAGRQTAEAAAATSGLSGELQTGAGAQKEYASTTEAAAAAVRGQRDALVSLSTHLKAEVDPVFGYLEAQQQLTDGQKDAAEAVKKYGKNSAEAKEATRNLALAAIELQGRAGELGGAFNGKMTPALRATLNAAGLTDKQIESLAGQFRDAKKSGDDYSKRYKADVSLSGYDGVKVKLDRLAAYQQGLKKGTIQPGMYGPYKGADGKYFATGGWTGPGGKWDEAGVVHADEFVIKKESRQKIERQNPGLLDEMNATGQVRGYADGGRVWSFKTTVAGTRVPSLAEVAAVVGPVFDRDWPSSPSAQRGDSGVWRQVLRLIQSGPKSGSFGNAYRPGDPKWHGSGRAIDWMGHEQDALASFLASKGPLELIHRTRNRDYAYTRGVNKGSFNNALMEAHRNHIHIAMKDGGVIREPVMGVGASGNTYSFGENWQPERVVPMHGGAGAGGATVTIVLENRGVIGSQFEVNNWLAGAVDDLKRRGRI